MNNNTMKKILYTILVALSLGSLTLAAQTTSIEQRYFIDGKVVEDFDGSQLEGQEIVTYKMDLTQEGLVTYKNHYITTKQYVTKTVVFPTREPKKDTEDSQVYVVDGKIVTMYDFLNLNYYDIEKIDVIRAYMTENEFIKKYSTDGRDVIMVTLKKEKSKRYKAFGEVGRFTNKKEEGTKNK